MDNDTFMRGYAVKKSLIFLFLFSVLNSTHDEYNCMPDMTTEISLILTPPQDNGDNG